MSRAGHFTLKTAVETTNGHRAAQPQPKRSAGLPTRSRGEGKTVWASRQACAWEGRSSGIGILTAPISLTPAGTVIALSAVGTFDNQPNRSMGTASLRRVGGTFQAMADFTPVGSAMVRVEVFRGSNLVGSAVVPPGGRARRCFYPLTVRLRWRLEKALAPGAIRDPAECKSAPRLRAPITQEMFRLAGALPPDFPITQA
jgi:hypothetical protein